ncbi:MAG: hypothetical protein EPN48_09090 [Microbacteriaceae bacterium]|nr:MAG: hypothetical protein EPN48_09090 [Microbacteriaceae bacterium]
MTTTERPKMRVKKDRAEKPPKAKKDSAGRVAGEERARGSRPGTRDLDTDAPSSRPTRSAKPQAAKAARPAKAPKDGLALGPEPRVDLMPQSIRLQRKRSKTARRLGFAVVGVVVLTLAGVAASTYASLVSEQNLAAAQANTQNILRQQAKYMPVRTVQARIGLVQAAQQVGASTEIDWKTYLTAVQNTLPAGVQMGTVKIDSASPLAAYAQASAPLQGSRVATLSFAATTATLPQVPAWLNALATLPGYADGAPGTVTRNENGSYVANVTLHINEAAFDKRFEPKKGK